MQGCEAGLDSTNPRLMGQVYYLNWRYGVVVMRGFRSVQAADRECVNRGMATRGRYKHHSDLGGDILADITNPRYDLDWA